MATSKPHTKDIYRSIIATAGSIARWSASSIPDKTVPSSGMTIHATAMVATLSLNPPASILPTLLEDGMSEDISQKLAHLHQQFSNDLCDRMETSFQDTWAQIIRIGTHPEGTSLSELRTQLIKTHESLYIRRVQTWVDDIRQRARTRLAGSSRVHTHEQSNISMEKGSAARTQFNQDYIPKLEVYFKRNQNPSQVDKEYLAKKSGMTYRQISVWFQNRRSRTKSVVSEPCPRTKFFDNTRQSTISKMENEELEGDEHTLATISSKPLSSTLVDEDGGFKSRSPLYAFPELYPPSLPDGYDPFPCRFGDFSTFAKPDWSRRPIHINKGRQSIVDLDSLVTAFKKLRIEGVIPAPLIESEGSPSVMSTFSKSSSCDVTSPYTVRPLRAPLMALVRNFTSRIVRGPSNSSDSMFKSKSTVMEVPADNKTIQPATHMPHRIPARESAVGLAGDNNSSPSSKSQKGLITSSAHITTSNPPASTSTAGAQSKTKKPSKKSPASRCKSAKSASRRAKKRSAPAERQVEPSSSASSSSHPSPTSSTESLPSLSYSSTSSSASTCSQSPTLYFENPGDDSLIPSLDVYQSSGACLHLPPTHNYFDAYPLPIFPPSELSFDFSRGPLDITFGLDFPTYPSYSDSFDLIQQGLQFSPDFAPPVLAFDLSFFES